MKLETKWRQFLALFAIILVMGACGGEDNEKSEEEVQLDKLRGTWTLASVENDDIDRTDEYPGMTVTLSGSYTAGGVYQLSSQANPWPSLSPWKASDTWKFDASNIPSVIVRQSDVTDITYTLSNDDARLTLEFDYSGTGYKNSRTATVGGHWVFTFTK